MKSKHLKVQSVNAGSMADIAFLLLIFFLVSTTILQEKGIMMQLPPEPEDRTTTPVNERNLFKILVNANNQYLVQDVITDDLGALKAEIKKFVLNEGHDPSLSVSPQKAVISIKTSRGTEYGYFIEVLDEVKAAYYEIYAERLGLTPEEYRHLDIKNPVQLQMYERGRSGIPMNISIAEPDKI